MAAQQFLGVHRQHVAVEHGGRLQERFRQRQRRQFHRKTAGHQHAALDVIDAALEVHVAGLRVGPGVEDRDDRPVPSTPPARSPSASRANGGRRRGDRRAQTSARCGVRRGISSWSDWVPHFCTVFRSTVRKIRFSTIRPMTITVNSPANTAGMSSRLRFSKMNQSGPPAPRTGQTPARPRSTCATACTEPPTRIWLHRQESSRVLQLSVVTVSDLGEATRAISTCCSPIFSCREWTGSRPCGWCISKRR